MRKVFSYKKSVISANCKYLHETEYPAASVFHHSLYYSNKHTARLTGTVASSLEDQGIKYLSVRKVASVLSPSLHLA